MENPINLKVQNFGDAFYFTVVAVSTVGFGDIVPVTQAGRLVTVAMIISGIIIIPFQAARIFRAWLMTGRKRRCWSAPVAGWTGMIQMQSTAKIAGRLCRGAARADAIMECKLRIRTPFGTF